MYKGKKKKFQSWKVSNFSSHPSFLRKLLEDVLQQKKGINQEIGTHRDLAQKGEVIELQRMWKKESRVATMWYA